MALIDDFARERDESRKRLLLLIAGFAMLAVIVVIRLAYLQVLHAREYREQLDDWLILQPDYLPALRGDIRDRDGKVLAQDVPSWQVEAYYGILDAKPLPSGRSSYLARYVRRLAKRLRRGGQMPAGDVPIEATEEALHQRIAESWQKLSDLAGQPTWRMYQTADTLVERIRAARQRWADRTGNDDDIGEQDQFHPILKDLPADRANLLRLELAGYPWFRVHTSTSRQYADDRCISHLVGRLREVSQEDLDPETTKDPYAGDELRGLRAGDSVGGSGVEYAAEGLLRGRRGKVRRNRTNRANEAGEYLVNIAPVRGQDVHLTIDLEWQRWIYDELGRTVHECPTASSASAVVLDIASREARAVVSWPGYSQQEYNEQRSRLLADTVHQPLRFHAVADCYAAGSIVKPITVMAALAGGLASPEETIDCTGYLYPDVRNAFRCWTASRGMPGHGPLNARKAIMNSCNVYCYTMGRRVGVARQCQWFDLFGLGRSPGTGLLEEATGTLPTPEYLAKCYGHRLSQADLTTAAQNFAIGQEAVMVTPLQAANLAATIATGVWQPVVLLAEQAQASRAARRALPGTAEGWRSIREGMFDVVNDPGGTAHQFACSESLKRAGIQIAGKTGTAQTGPRPIGYTYQLTMHDGSIRTMEFDNPVAAADRIAQMGEAVVKWQRTGTRYWPGPFDPEHQPNHAWFMAFAPAHHPQVAVAVVVEYGMAGGRTAGPVAQHILERIFGVEVSHRDLGSGDTGPTD